MSTETAPKTELPKSLDGAASTPPAASAPTPLQRLEMVKRYRADGTLIEKEDYGLIPGAQGQKPTLLKPGAQKLCGLFSLAPVIKNTNRVIKDDLIAYEVQMQVVCKNTGTVEAEGMGMCNSRERKYKNKDAWDVANTLLKMAEKRALVDATLNALGISSLFTQDIEDMDLSEEQLTKPAQPATAPKAPSVPATSEAIAAYNERRNYAITEKIGEAGFQVPPPLGSNPSATKVAKWTKQLESDLDAFEAQQKTQEMAA